MRLTIPRSWRSLPAAILAVTFALAAPATSAVSSFRFGPPLLVDHVSPFGAPAVWGALSCPTVTFCLNVGTYDVGGGATLNAGNAAFVSTTTPTGISGAWTPTVGVGPGAPASVSCPSASFCAVAETGAYVGQTNAIATSTRPRSGPSAWTVRRVNAGLLQGISCPSSSLCVAVDGAVGEPAVFVSTDPTSATPTWSKTRLAGGTSDTSLAAISCVSASLCVAIDSFSGRILTSTNPTGGVAAWTFTQLTAPSKPSMLALSCPSASLCVATGRSGDIISSSDPAAGAGSWTVAHVDPTQYARLTTVGCPSVSLCVAADEHGAIFASGSPAGGSAAWSTIATVAQARFGSVACPSSSLCLLDTQAGAVETVAAPLSGAAAIGDAGELLGTTAIEGLSCPTATFCAGVGGGGALTSTHPAGAASTWRLAAADPAAELTAISCPTIHFCAAAGVGDALATTSNPTGGRASWITAQLNLQDYQGNNLDISAISCVSARFCVVATDRYLAFSSNPSAGGSAWHANTAGDSFDGTYIGNNLDSVSCPSVSLCVAGDTFYSGNGSGGVSGGVAVSQGRRAGRSWRFINLRAGILAVSCPTNRFCAATDGRGDVFTADPSVPGRRAWRRSRIDPGHALTGVSCTRAHLCAAIEDGTRVFVSRNPGGGASTWRAAKIDTGTSPVGVANGPLSAISCGSVHLCVAGDLSGNVIVGR